MSDDVRDIDHTCEALRIDETSAPITNSTILTCLCERCTATTRDITAQCEGESITGISIGAESGGTNRREIIASAINSECAISHLICLYYLDEYNCNDKIIPSQQSPVRVTS